MALRERIALSLITFGSWTCLTVTLTFMRDLPLLKMAEIEAGILIVTTGLAWLIGPTLFLAEWRKLGALLRRPS
jgi:hypothetical protein